MLKLITLLFLAIRALDCVYISWTQGSPEDFVLPNESVLDGGIVIAGGSTDQDEAMQWFLRKARGGDVIVFRNARNATSTSAYPTADAYNPYFYSELGVKIDSCETIFLNSPNVGNDLDVSRQVRNAEAIFFTGGDQAFYWTNIKGTLLENALDYAVNVKKVVIGGTSAGAAVLGEFLFSAEVNTISSAEALANPYNSKLTLRDNLFKFNLLKNTITDTHYNNPDRRGRHISFMARMFVNYPTDPIVHGIGVEEKVAVCVESNGRAYVYSSVGASAHFISQKGPGPETCRDGSSLDWYRNKEALEVYKVAGTRQGDRFFDISTWKTGFGGQYGFYYVDRGTFGQLLLP